MREEGHCMVTSNFWKKLFQASAKSRQRQMGTAVAAAEIEPFESRCYLSVSPIFNASTGALTISGTDSDSIAVAADLTGLVTVNGSPLTTMASAVKSLIVS